MAGFSKTVMSAKKQDPSVFEKAQMGEVALLEGGTRLAARALAIGSVLAIVGVGGLCFTFWKLTGAKNVINCWAECQEYFHFPYPYLFVDGRVLAEDEHDRRAESEEERPTAESDRVRWAHGSVEVRVQLGQGVVFSVLIGSGCVLD